MDPVHAELWESQSSSFKLFELGDDVFYVSRSLSSLPRVVYIILASIWFLRFLRLLSPLPLSSPPQNPLMVLGFCKLS